MNKTIVALGVLLTLSAIFQFLTFAGIGRLRCEQREFADALSKSHNWTTNRLRGVSCLILAAIDVLAGRVGAKSLQEGDDGE